MTAETITTVALSFVGNREKPGNTGFVNPDFQKLMNAAGWYMKAPWCAFFTRVILVIVFALDHRLAVIKRCCSGNAQQTFKNFKAEGTFKTGMIPKDGALAVWQFGNSTAGHIGLVVKGDHSFNTMQTVEGNTNGNGSREGDQVAIKLRTINRPRTDKGLNLIGFIYLV